MLCPIPIHLDMNRFVLWCFVVVWFALSLSILQSPFSPMIYLITLPFVIMLVLHNMPHSLLIVNHMFTDLSYPFYPIFSWVREIQGYQRFPHHLCLPSRRGGLLPSSPTWCPGELSETLWAWRTARRPPATPCSTSAFTWPSAIWTKPSSPSSSSRGKAVQTCRRACLPWAHPPCLIAVIIAACGPFSWAL